MRLMDLTEAAEFLRISKDTLRMHIKEGRLVAYQPGGKNAKWFFDQDELEKWVKSSAVGRFQ